MICCRLLPWIGCSRRLITLGNSPFKRLTLLLISLAKSQLRCLLSILGLRERTHRRLVKVTVKRHVRFTLRRIIFNRILLVILGTKDLTLRNLSLHLRRVREKLDRKRFRMIRVKKLSNLPWMERITLPRVIAPRMIFTLLLCCHR